MRSLCVWVCIFFLSFFLENTHTSLFLRRGCRSKRLMQASPKGSSLFVKVTLPSHPSLWQYVFPSKRSQVENTFPFFARLAGDTSRPATDISSFPHMCEDGTQGYGIVSRDSKLRTWDLKLGDKKEWAFGVMSNMQSEQTRPSGKSQGSNSVARTEQKNCLLEADPGNHIFTRETQRKTGNQVTFSWGRGVLCIPPGEMNTTGDRLEP